MRKSDDADRVWRQGGNMPFVKNTAQVLIGGKVYPVTGFESEQYLQSLATYLNHKIDECSNAEGYLRLSQEIRGILLALNVADDYFKAKKQGSELEKESVRKDKEMYDLKHDLISAQLKCESLEKELLRVREENQALKLRMAKTEAAAKNSGGRVKDWQT